MSGPFLVNSYAVESRTPQVASYVLPPNEGSQNKEQTQPLEAAIVTNENQYVSKGDQLQADGDHNINDWENDAELDDTYKEMKDDIESADNMSDELDSMSDNNGSDKESDDVDNGNSSGVHGLIKPSDTPWVRDEAYRQISGKPSIDSMMESKSADRSSNATLDSSRSSAYSRHCCFVEYTNIAMNMDESEKTHCKARVRIRVQNRKIVGVHYKILKRDSTPEFKSMKVCLHNYFEWAWFWQYLTILNLVTLFSFCVSFSVLSYKLGDMSPIPFKNIFFFFLLVIALFLFACSFSKVRSKLFKWIHGYFRHLWGPNFYKKLSMK